MITYMRRLISALILGLLPVTAQAGDPCPIPVNIRDLGTPDWLDRDELLQQLQVQKSWIGISFSYRETGIEITYIHPNSAAAAAGLKVGDIVSVINEVPMTDAAERDAMFDALKPGDQISFTRIDQPAISTRVGYTDPVPFGIYRALEEQDCRAVNIRTVDPQERADILPILFNETRGFRCEDAHIALQTLGERYEINEVYVVRGSRRLLITMPYWGTSCISVASLDGENYTTTQLLNAVDRVIGDYVQDRFDNP